MFVYKFKTGNESAVSILGNDSVMMVSSHSYRLYSEIYLACCYVLEKSQWSRCFLVICFHDRTKK